VTFSTLRPSRLRRANPDRREKLRAQAFGVHGPRVEALRCCACGALPPSDPHHYLTRQSQGGGDWRHIAPLCRRCHRQLDSPGWSRPAFEAHHGIDLAEVAAMLAEVADRPQTACSADDLARRLRAIETAYRLPMIAASPVRVPKSIATGTPGELAEWLIRWDGACEVGRVLDLWEYLEGWRNRKPDA
jgi:hypothetical protein